QRRARRPGRDTRAGRQRDLALLHDRGSPGGQDRLPRAPQAQLFKVSQATMSVFNPAMMAEGSPAHKALHAWWLAIRPKTLSAGVVPVLVGTGLAYGRGVGHILPALAALLGAVCIQVGTNLTNDFY